MHAKLTLEKKSEAQDTIVELFPAAPAGRAASENWTLEAAREISEYLLTGWNHNTETGRAAIAAIIEKHYQARGENDEV